MPATAKPAPQSKLRDLRDRMRIEAADRWRAWAKDIAAGGQPPLPRDILEAGALLGIEQPGEALEHDAEAINELTRAEENIEMCAATGAEALKPWGGKPERLAAALQEKKLELQRMQELFNTWCDGGPGSFWRSRVHDIKRKHTRLFPGYMTGAAS